MRIQDLFMEFQNRLVCKQEDLFKLVASDLFIYVYEERGMTKATASSKKICKLSCNCILMILSYLQFTTA